MRIILGKRGSGKTHLLVAEALRFLDTPRAMGVLFIVPDVEVSLMHVRFAMLSGKRYREVSRDEGEYLSTDQGWKAIYFRRWYGVDPPTGFGVFIDGFERLLASHTDRLDTSRIVAVTLNGESEVVLAQHTSPTYAERVKARLQEEVEKGPDARWPIAEDGWPKPMLSIGKQD